MLLLLILALQGVQAAPSPGTGLILGRVVDAGTGRPVSDAIVSMGTSIGTPRAVTNANGQFVFRKVPKGRFSLLAAKPGYAEGAYGRRAPGGTPRSVELDDGQRIGDITISMWRQAAISGTVTDEAGEPVIGAVIRVFHRRFASGQIRYAPAGTLSTDDRGIYRTAGLVPGDYVVAFVSRQVSMPPDVADITRNPPAPSDMKGQAIMRERFALGGPFAGAPGTPSGTQVGPTVRQIDPSGPVPPISADAASPVFIYPTVFFPNSPTAARAGVVKLQSGQERDGVDLSLHPVRASTVSGSVIGSEGPASYVAVHLMSGADGGVPELESATTMTDANGNFTLPGIVAGQYVITAQRVPRPPAPQPQNMVTTIIQTGGGMVGMSASVNDSQGPPPVSPIPEEPALYASMTLAVADSDLKDVIVPLQRGGSVSGRVEFEGTSDRPDADALSRMGILLNQVDGAPQIQAGVFASGETPFGRVEANGAFKTYGQAPGKYVIRPVRTPTGWTFKSAMFQGRDIADTSLDLGGTDIGNVVITFTDRPTKLTGVARTKAGNPDTDALVVVFPSDPNAWTTSAATSRRMRSARPSNDGTYTFTALPAGDYYVASILEGAVSEWQDPQALADIARTATQVRIADGDTKTQNVERSGGDR